MKKIVLILISVILTLSIANRANSKIKMESLSGAIENIESTYLSVSDLTANFSQKTYVAVLNKNISNSGIFRWKKPGKFFIDYTGQQPKQYISNNKKMWVYVPGDTQVEVYRVSEDTVSKEALEFMRGFVDIKNNYNISGWDKSGNVTEFTFVPKLRGAPYARLKCRFRSDHLLDQVTIYNVTGNVSTYNFSNIRINNALPDDIFKFQNPKGVKSVYVK